MEEKKAYCYWKRPRYKYWNLAAAVCWLLLMIAELREYGEVRALSPEIFSPAAFEEYAAARIFSAAARGTLSAAFLGNFLIGCFAKSSRAAALAQSMLGFAAAAAMGAALFLTAPRLQPLWLRAGPVLLLLAAGFFWLYRWRRTPPEP